MCSGRHPRDQEVLLELLQGPGLGEVEAPDPGAAEGCQVPTDPERPTKIPSQGPDVRSRGAGDHDVHIECAERGHGANIEDVERPDDDRRPWTLIAETDDGRCMIGPMSAPTAGARSAPRSASAGDPPRRAPSASSLTVAQPRRMVAA
jgi:hypothetical protein